MTADAQRALSGRRILVTRAVDDAAIWSRELEELGAETDCLPCIQCETIADEATVRALASAVAEANWLVLTSPRGVEAVDAILTEESRPALETIQLAAVGPATAAVVERRFGRVDRVAAEGTALSLAEGLLADLSARPGRVLFAASDRGRRDLEQALVVAGIATDRVDVYRTVPARLDGASKVDLAARQVDTILLASPSAAEGLAELAEIPANAEIYTIGPTTFRAAEKNGWRVTAEAIERSLGGLVAAIVEKSKSGAASV